MKPNVAPKKTLFDEDHGRDDESETERTSSSSEKLEKLTVNKKFARAYQDRKEQEELRKAREQGRGLDSGEESDSSDEEEDEDGNLLSSSVNLQFVNTIKALRNKESTIYDRKTRFFDETNNKTGNMETEERKKKPQRYKDVVREQILQQMDQDDSQPADNTGEDSSPREAKASKFAYDKQQDDLRKDFLRESKKHDGESSDEEDDDDWMVVKNRVSNSADDPAETAFQEELKELQGAAKNESQATFKDPRGEVGDGEKFLFDYIQNKKWMDKNDDDSSSPGADHNDGSDHGESDASSVEDIDRADDFEANYNFRFEQAAEKATSGANLSIQTYARGQTMNTVRRQDTTRRDKRLSRKDRKEAERKEKEEQLKRLKNAKRQEMNKKLSHVKSVVGAVDQGAVDEVAIMKMLEGDYDPEKFEKAMQEAYGDDFYHQEDPEWKTDVDVRESLQHDEDGDAVVGKDDVDGGLYDNYGDEEAEAYDEEEWDGEEYEGNDAEVEVKETELEKNLKTKMQEELYKLDYEDIVAGMPTRFKYRQVEPNSYGLSSQEILLARDTNLKQFVSLRRMAPYNDNGEFHVGSKKRRKFRDILKKDLEEEKGDEKDGEEAEATDKVDENEAEEPKKKKRRRLKKGKKKDKDDAGDKNGDEGGSHDAQNKDQAEGEQQSKAEATTSTDGKSDSDDHIQSAKESTTPPAAEKNKKKKKRKKKGKVGSLSGSRLSSYGL